MKITLIGSSQYGELFQKVKVRLMEDGHEVRIPAFDTHPNLDELGICEYNRSLIEWADEVHVIWDGRSLGTCFDFGMLFALRKPFVIEYIEPKTFKGVMERYEAQCQTKKQNIAPTRVCEWSGIVEH